MRRALPAALVGFFAALVAWHAAHEWFGTTDTFGLLESIGPMDECLHDRVLTNCGAEGHGRLSASPLLQYLAALSMKRAGLDLQEAYRGLTHLNAAAFLALAALMWHAGRRLAGSTTAPLAVGLVIAGPLLWYSHSGFGESLAAFVTALFVAALALGWPPVVGGLALCLAAISKNPALLFLVPLGAAVLLARHPRRRVRIGEVLVYGGAAAVGAAATLWFNAFRSGAAISGDPIAAATVPFPSLALRLEHAGGLLVAPNVGLLWFWPLALAALVVTLVAVRHARAPRGAGGVLALAVLGLVAAVVSFFTPYGWEAWGPRYLLPWIPAFVLAGLALYGRAIEQIVRRAVGRARAVVVALAATIVIAFGLPHVGGFVDWPLAFTLFNPDQGCVSGLADIHQWANVFGLDSYYECTRHIAWSRRPVMLTSLESLGGPYGALLALSFAGAVGGLVVMARRAARDGPAPDAS